MIEKIRSPEDKAIGDRIEKLVKDAIEYSKTHPVKPKYFYDRPRKYKLSEDEKLSMSKKFQIFLELNDKAIRIVKKYIEKFETNPQYKLIVEDLKIGLKNLEGGRRRDIEEGLEGFIADLERSPKGRRPLLGLNRGFREFFGHGHDWQMEILEAVNAIELYYRSL